MVLNNKLNSFQRCLIFHLFFVIIRCFHRTVWINIEQEGCAWQVNICHCFEMTMTNFPTILVILSILIAWTCLPYFNQTTWLYILSSWLRWLCRVFRLCAVLVSADIRWLRSIIKKSRCWRVVVLNQLGIVKKGWVCRYGWLIGTLVIDEPFLPWRAIIFSLLAICSWFLLCKYLQWV